MLIPSIDLMGGKVVQLVQGRRKVLEYDFAQFGSWLERFSRYPIIQLIDLDAAMGVGDNSDLVSEIAKLLPCQFGGGIRSVQSADAALNLGAKRVIVGSALIRQGNIDQDFATQMSAAVGREKLIFAADSLRGRVAIKGWKETTHIETIEFVRRLQAFCSGFLYTHIDTEGSLQGIPMDVISRLRHATSNQLIAAGGIRSQQEVDALHAMNVDAVVGMAIYKGLVTT